VRFALAGLAARRGLLRVGLPALFFVMYAFFALTAPEFFTVSNTQDVVRQGSTLAILAFGQTFAVLSAGVDLSVGATLGLASVVDAMVAKQHGIPAGMVAALLVGIAAGLVNGVFIAKLRVNPFIVTLGTLSVFQGVALSISGGSYIQDMPQGFSDLGYDSLGPIPLAAMAAGIVFLFSLVILTQTRFGRAVYAVGGNPEAARLSGIPVTRTRWLIYILTGLTAGVAGIVLSSRVSSGQPLLGQGLELQSVAAVVLGGISLFGGEGTALGVLFGVLLVSFLQNGLNLLNVSSFLQYAIIGSALVLAVTLDRLSRSPAEPG
jgi:ribose transport system permease protein